MIQEKQQKQRRKMKKKSNTKRRTRFHVQDLCYVIYISKKKERKKSECQAANVIEDPITEVQD